MKEQVDNMQMGEDKCFKFSGDCEALESLRA